jgi:outer membrane protein
MKKIAILLAAWCITMSAYAQFEKGNKLVGGSLGADFTTDKTKVDGTTYTNGRNVNFSFDPQVAYFVINNLAVGGALGFSTESYKEDDSDYKSVDNEITIQPVARYYLSQGIFFQGNFIVGSAKNKVTDNGDTDETKYNVSGWSLSAGYAYFLNDHVAIEPQLGYSGKGYKNKENDVKYVDNGLYIRVGFQIYLGK